MLPSALTTAVPLAGPAMIVTVTSVTPAGPPPKLSLASTFTVTGVFCAVEPVSSAAAIAGAITVTVAVAWSQLAGLRISQISYTTV